MRIQNPQLRELFKTPQRKTYTTLVLTLVTVGVLIFFTIRPTFIKIAELRKELKDKKTFLERIDKKQRNLNYLIDEKASFTNELDIFSKNLPEEIKGGFIVANLSEIANLQNVDLLSIEFSEEIEEEEEIVFDYASNIKKVDIKINLAGSYNDLENYIEFLERFPRIFDIRHIRYSNEDLLDYEGDLDDYKPINCSVDMYTFYWINEIESKEVQE